MSREEGKFCMILYLYVESKKDNKLANITEKKQSHRCREQTSGYQWGQGRGEWQYKDRGLRGTNYYVENKLQGYCTTQGI